jgi:hypothetical protein
MRTPYGRGDHLRNKSCRGLSRSALERNTNGAAPGRFVSRRTRAGMAIILVSIPLRRSVLRRRVAAKVGRARLHVTCPPRTRSRPRVPAAQAPGASSCGARTARDIAVRIGRNVLQEGRLHRRMCTQGQLTGGPVLVTRPRPRAASGQVRTASSGPSRVCMYRAAPRTPRFADASGVLTSAPRPPLSW